MSQHLSALGLIYLVFSALNIIAALLVFGILTGAGILSGEPHATVITSTIGAVIAWFLILTSLPGLIGGIGILKRRGWARILLLTLGAFELLHFPIGTGIGIYTFWVLTRPEIVAQLS